jgi:hypothetical protein
MTLFFSLSHIDENHGVKPSGGFVPDEETAIKIAVAVWTPIYGKQNIEDQKPYKAELKNNVWHVYGSLPPDKEIKDKNGNVFMETSLGGVAEAMIEKNTGQILKITHGE